MSNIDPRIASELTGNGLAKAARPARAGPALRIGAELAVGVYEAWRRELNCIDALILLTISRSNVDGILYDRELRARFGNAAPVAPDDLRQPVSVDVVAMSLRLPPAAVRRRAGQLAAVAECAITRLGMLITADQVEATKRLTVVETVYPLLHRSYSALRAANSISIDGLPSMQTQCGAPPLRNAAAHAAKYTLRLFGSLARDVGDSVDGLILAKLLCEPDATTVGGAGRLIGLPASTFARRAEKLVTAGVCRRRGKLIEIGGTRAETWRRSAERRNSEYIFQLVAGLAEVGALADFTA